jgi:hypothetical protein
MFMDTFAHAPEKQQKIPVQPSIVMKYPAENLETPKLAVIPSCHLLIKVLLLFLLANNWLGASRIQTIEDLI